MSASLLVVSVRANVGHSEAGIVSASNVSDDEDGRCGAKLETAQRATELIRTGAEAEIQLLKRERKAEKRLAGALATFAADRARVQRAQGRLARSQAVVAAAASELRQRQEERALGPMAPGSGADTTSGPG
jgi:hypothetical protein